MRFHEDDRAIRYCDLFGGVAGDVNFFRVKGRQASGWHRHQEQTDQFFVSFGVLTVGLWRDGEAPAYTRLKRGETLIIPPGLWHGYQAGAWGTEVIMYLSHKYEDGWDEEKRSFAEVPWAPPT